MLDLSEWRDLGLILLAVGFGVVSLACLVATLIAGRIGFRVIRGLQRVHDDRLLTLLNTIEQRQTSWREQGLLDPQGLPELARRLAALRHWRRPKPKRRLWGLLPPAR